jgi:mannose-6-phosphate isomerase-like protein (cupin superfamily)
MAVTKPETRRLGATADVIAPDGCEVRLLPEMPRGSMAHFSLGPHEISHAIVHRTVEEIWFFLTGHGQIWRRLGDWDEVVEVGPEVSLTIPVGAHFQLRNDGPEPLTAVAITMPPWPGQDEAVLIDGKWSRKAGGGN